jgi:hypothetical protein
VSPIASELPLSLGGGSPMRDFLFGVVWIGQGRLRLP